ncbi:MAG: glycosyltransferase family 4 protein [Anaerolineae bacterium]
MRILALSSLYPPRYLGGYELGCRDVMERLRRRGYETGVLTSAYGLRGSSCQVPGALEVPDVKEGRVWRVLDFRTLSFSQKEPITSRAWRELRNHWALHRVLDAFRPDVAMLWDLAGLLKTLPLALQKAGLPVIYALSSSWLLEYADPPDRWLAFWAGRPKGFLRRWVKRAALEILKVPLGSRLPLWAEPLDLRFAFFTSQALKARHLEAGMPIAEARVIHWGIPLELFRPGERLFPLGEVKLLFAGRVVREKGVHTAIEALALLRGSGLEIRLDIAGPCPDEGYLAFLKELAAGLGLAGRVNFVGFQRREEMPEIYRSHDVLVFPSLWEEPFPLTLLEAMACSMPVVSTATGGGAEILIDGENSLTFPPGNVPALARSLKRLLSDRNLYASIATGALRTARRFDIERMVDEIEALLARIGR